MNKIKKRIGVIGIALALLIVLPTIAYAHTIEDEQKLAAKTGITVQQVDALIDSGYTLNEIEKLNPSQVDFILQQGMTTLEKQAYNAAKTIGNGAVFATAPSNFNCVASVPDGGGTDEWFHSNANTTESTINTVVADAKSIAQSIFDSSAGYPTIRSSYYLFGEWGEDPGREKWCHEGIDMQHATQTTASVYSPISGYVTRSSTSGKYVNIYNSDLGITVNIQHLDHLDGTDTLVEGSYVFEGQYLGNQNTTNRHVHLQVCNHEECTSVHTGQDLNLECVRPYDYL